MALPARSAADAAAPLVVSHRMLRLLVDDPDIPRFEIDCQLCLIRRVTAGFLSMLAEGSGIDLAAIGWSDDEFRFEFAMQFPR